MKSPVMKKSGVEQTSWYDYPEWFEIGFDDVTGQEADFFEKAFKRWCKFPVHRLLEPACGSGRVVMEMARRGYDVTGFDLSAPSVKFLQNRLKGSKLKVKAFEGDMTRFKFPKPFDSIFCTYNSFRILTTEEQAQSFLKCVAAALRPGGLFFLGLHLAPPELDPLGIERWTGQRGRTHVTTTLRVIASDVKRRVERLRINLLVREYSQNGASHANGKASRNGKAGANGKAKVHAKPKKARGVPAGKHTVRRLIDEFDYRLYTAAQIK